MGAIEQGPTRFCFGNFTLEDRECKICPNRSECWDDQQGWGINVVVADCEGTELIEGKTGGVPDWVFKWDELSEAELKRLKIEEPKRFRVYSLLNSGIRD